jgi:thiol:disulfide interchange protein DsbD
MKKIVLAFFTFILTTGLFAQIKDPVSWKYETIKQTGNNYQLLITATVPKPWHIYSQNTPKGGPIPTKIKINTNPLITVAAGKAKEIGKLERTLDKNFSAKGVEVLFYADQIQFVQNFTVKGTVKTNISGTVEYMVCDDSQCLPPTKKTFDIKIQ